MQFAGRLEEFVRETLVEIVNGVVAARRQLAESGAKVGFGSKQYMKLPNQPQSPPRFFGKEESVQFDLAVSTKQEKAKGAEGKLQVWVLSVGGGGEETSSAETVNRVRFSVPVVFPGRLPDDGEASD